MSNEYDPDREIRVDEQGNPLDCLVCGTEIEPAATGRPRKYCSRKCQEVASNAKKRDRNRKKNAEKYKPVLKEADDMVRDIMRDQVRKDVTRLVKDKVLGATEYLTDILPEAMHAMREDLHSDDWAVRSRAYALIMKYAMPVGQMESNEDKGMSITIAHNVPVPETPFGDRVIDVMDAKVTEVAKGGLLDPSKPYDPVSNPEAYEADWDLCSCDTPRRHPPGSVDATGRCDGCEHLRRAQRGNDERVENTGEPIEN